MIELGLTQANREALVVVLGYRVHNTGNSVGTVNSGCAVAQYFDALQTEHGEMVRVDRVNGYEAAADDFRLEGRHVHHAAAVQQH